MEKYFILRINNWFIGFYRGTMEELADALKTIDTTITEVAEIDTKDLMLVFNHEVRTKTRVEGFDKELHKKIVSELKDVFANNGVKTSFGHGEELERIARLELNWHPTEFDTDIVSVLVSDGEKRPEPNTIYIGGREFKKLSEFNANDFWRIMGRDHKMSPVGGFCEED